MTYFPTVPNMRGQSPIFLFPVSRNTQENVPNLTTSPYFHNIWLNPITDFRTMYM